MTTTARSRSLTVLGLACVLGTAWLTSQAVSANAAAQAAAGVPASVRIAVIDLDKVREGLAEATALSDKLKKQAEELQKNVDTLVAQLENEKSKAEALPADQKKAAQAKAQEKLTRALFEKEWSQNLLNRQEASSIAFLYERIDTAVDIVAKREGYHMVMTSDEKLSLKESDKESMKTVAAYISVRRTLYIDPSIDITQQVIDFMNNEFKAGR